MKRAAKSKSRKIGLIEWFRPGDYERVETVLRDIQALEVTELRTGIYWADWYTSEGDGWYAWLLPRLAKDVTILPCFLYTPPCLGIVPKFSSPPRTPKAYADFIDLMITHFGDLFEWLELWNEPNNQNQWDNRLDPDWRIFTEMIGGAAYWAQHRGKKTVLPGLWPRDLEWLELMFERGVVPYIDAVGIHGFPGSAEFPWSGWTSEVRNVRKLLERHDSKAELWITETGFSTWRDEERTQLRTFVDAMDASVERVYWHS